MKINIEYQIWGKSMKFGMMEELDTANSLKEAKQLVTEYKMAFDAGWRIWIKKVIT